MMHPGELLQQFVEEAQDGDPWNGRFARVHHVGFNDPRIGEVVLE